MEHKSDPAVRLAVNSILAKAAEAIPLLDERKIREIAVIYMLERFIYDRSLLNQEILKKIHGRTKWTLLEQPLDRLRRLQEATSETLLHRIVRL